jgi:hypothetical protein
MKFVGCFVLLVSFIKLVFARSLVSLFIIFKYRYHPSLKERKGVKTTDLLVLVNPNSLKIYPEALIDKGIINASVGEQFQFCYFLFFLCCLVRFSKAILG